MHKQKHRVRLNSHPYKVHGAPVPRLQASSAGTPSGCVRGVAAFIGKDECEAGKSSGQVCNPRYINGTWDRFSPYARDSASCGGVEPPNLSPQILNDASLVHTSSWGSLDNLSLVLMMEGHIGTFTYSMDGAPSQSVVFNQPDLAQELDAPLMYVYSVPHGAGVMRLTLNLTNGRATVTWPVGSGFGNVQYSIGV
jgi:hypothetical protein